MLQELINFTNEIANNNPNYFTDDLRPSDGLHIFIKLDNNGNLPRDIDGETPLKECFKTFVVNKKTPKIEEWDEISKYEYYSDYFDSNKWLDSKNMKIHSTIPYSLWFKKGSVDNPVKGLTLENSFTDFFSSAIALGSISDIEIALINQIQSFCKYELIGVLKSNSDYQSMKGREKDNPGDYIKIYFVHVSMELIRRSKERYLSKKLFLKDTYNVKLDDQIVGLSSFQNTLGDKKKFLQHITTSFNVNTRISETSTASLYQFEKLLKAKPRKLPNPLPIFIDRKELNNDLVTIYSEDGTKSLGEMLRDILELHNGEYSDVGSYLLLNWASTKEGLVFNDVDFVANFRIVLDEPMVVQPIVNYSQGKYEAPTPICSTVLDFELIIIQKIFSNALVTRTEEGGFLRKYFDEISAKYSATTYQNVLRYRKAFYDFIYKSRHEAITARMWFDILWSEIRENIRQDKDFNKQFTIRELLDMLFSLNHHFDSTNSNFGGHYMPSLIPKLRDKVRAVIHSKGEKHLESDEEFCYAAGQLMYMLVFANLSGNKSHALIEPYISKTQIKQFKLALANGIQRYSHAFEILANGKGRTESLAAEVLGYDSEIDLKELLPITLAGYFSQSLVFEKLNDKYESSNVNIDNN